VARTLADARQETAEHLERQVAKLSASDDMPAAKVGLELDGRALRGIPSVSKFSASSAIDGTVPGSAAHLDSLSA
jgi:hypothetical protein